jgi:hypothetical protein
MLILRLPRTTGACCTCDGWPPIPSALICADERGCGGEPLCLKQTDGVLASTALRRMCIAVSIRTSICVPICIHASLSIRMCGDARNRYVRALTRASVRTVESGIPLKGDDEESGIPLKWGQPAVSDPT